MPSLSKTVTMSMTKGRLFRQIGWKGTEGEKIAVLDNFLRKKSTILNEGKSWYIFDITSPYIFHTRR